MRHYKSIILTVIHKKTCILLASQYKRFIHTTNITKVTVFSTVHYKSSILTVKHYKICISLASHYKRLIQKTNITKVTPRAVLQKCYLCWRGKRTVWVQGESIGLGTQSPRNRQNNKETQFKRINTVRCLKSGTSTTRC